MEMFVAIDSILRSAAGGVIVSGVTPHMVVAFLLVAATSGPVVAAQDANRCEQPALLLEGSPPARWSSALAALSSRLRRSADLDRCAKLLVRVEGDGLVVRVETADGRTAVRYVDLPEALIRTVEALLVLPLATSEPNDADIPSDDRPKEPTVQPDRRLNDRESAHVEFGVGALGRLSGSALLGGIGLSGFAQVALREWLIGVAARWEPNDVLLQQPERAGFNMQTYSIRALLGRCASLGALNLDALVGPAIVAESQEADGPGDGIGGTASDARLNVTLRLFGPSDSHTRLYAAGDIEGSLARLRHQKRLDPELPALPSWSAGLSLGVEWRPR
jgi:hypothetical protein